MAIAGRPEPTPHYGANTAPGADGHTGAMDWWGIAVIVVVGLAIVAYGYVDDKRRTRQRDEAIQAPPKRDIPRFEPKTEAPAYLSELQARTRPEKLASTDLTALTRTDLKAAQAGAPSIATGIPSESFVTDSPTGWAVAGDPYVAVLADRVDTVRELLPLLERAHKDGRPLVLAAPGFGTDVLDTLAANTVQGKAQCVPVVVDAAQAERVAALSLATPLAHTDLQSGWAPAEALGTIGTWISDRKHSWLIES